MPTPLTVSEPLTASFSTRGGGGGVSAQSIKRESYYGLKLGCCTDVTS